MSAAQNVNFLTAFPISLFPDVEKRTGSARSLLPVPATGVPGSLSRLQKNDDSWYARITSSCTREHLRMHPAAMYTF